VVVVFVPGSGTGLRERLPAVAGSGVLQLSPFLPRVVRATGGGCVQRSKLLRRGIAWGARRPVGRLRPNKWQGEATRCNAAPRAHLGAAGLARRLAGASAPAGAIGAGYQPVVLEWEGEEGPGATRPG